MSLAKLIPARVHALITDYGASLLLIIAALVASDASSEARWTGGVIGAVILLGSLITAYPMSMVKAIPFRVHSAMDYLGGLALIAAPFLLDFYDTDEGLSTLYIVVGVADILLSLVTDYEDPAAVQTEHGRTRATAGV